MIGVLRKNFICGKREFRFIGIVTAVVAAIVVPIMISGTTVLRAAIGSFTIFALTIVMIEENIEAEKKNGWNMYLRTMPVTVPKAMLAQYIYSLTVVLFGGLVSIALGLLCAAANNIFTKETTVSVLEACTPAIFITSLTMIILALDLPLVSRMSAAVTSAIKLVVFLAVGVLLCWYMLSVPDAGKVLFDMLGSIFEQKRTIVLLSPLAGLGLLGVSWLISCKTGFSC